MVSNRIHFPSLLIALLIVVGVTHGQQQINVSESDYTNGVPEETQLIQNNPLKKQEEPQVADVVNSTCQGGDNDDEDALDDFPQDLFTNEQRKHGAFIFHLMLAAYCFTLLGVVCNDYFLPAVECICTDLNISKDVAAATFMATATTMPEFFTNTISTLVTKSDIGIGTIIGSLMFNTLGVAALSGVAIKKSIQLDWWPVTRDCVCYSINTIVLIVVAWGGTITFTESLIMVVLCLTYYVVMFTQNRVMKTVRIFIEDKMNCCGSSRYDLTVPPEQSAKAKLPLGKETLNAQQDGVFIIRQVTTISSVSGSSISTISSGVDLINSPKHVDSDSLDVIPFKSFKKLITIPTEGGLVKKIWFFYSWPIKAFLTFVVPSPKYHRKFYPLTFIMCIALIGMNSYVIVWMLTVFGETFKIPATVMGMTFLAAGAATPEALSSLISVRKGENGIGVSNALGANSLAILLSLSFPWFLKNAMNYNATDGENVIHINSQGIEYTIGILLLSTLSLYIVMSMAGFRLRRTVGIALFSVYGVYITLQILIEMNVFFPPRSTC